ncbi:MAG: MGMT family protein [Candidatus Bathyarchaeia archaeon]
MVQASDKFNEREPCPIVCFPYEKVFLSVNPSTQPPGAKYGNCNPHLIEFIMKDSSFEMKPLNPIWDEGIFFTDHSYRGIAGDGIKKEILLLNINAKTSEQFWSFYEGGNWTRHGRISFPIRSCYPQVALKDHSAHVLAIGDIVEPVDEWRNYKFEKTGSGWDYVFRRLFYTWTPDIRKYNFSEPIEVDNLMRKVPAGKLVTINEIRAALARKHGATIGCPLTTGIFAWVAAHAAEERAKSGEKDVTPYWRTLKACGVLNEKYPGGVEAQKQRLEQEGHTVVRKGKKFLVLNYEKSLVQMV